jgi:hypothetical protein
VHDPDWRHVLFGERSLFDEISLFGRDVGCRGRHSRRRTAFLLPRSSHA